MSKPVKVEKFDTESNPFSIENMIKKEPKKEDSSNDSGYSANSEESGSENGLEKPLVSCPSYFCQTKTHLEAFDVIFTFWFQVSLLGQMQRPPVPMMYPIYQSEMYKNLVLYSNFLNMVQVRFTLAKPFLKRKFSAIMKFRLYHRSTQRDRGYISQLESDTQPRFDLETFRPSLPPKPKLQNQRIDRYHTSWRKRAENSSTNAMFATSDSASSAIWRYKLTKIYLKLISNLGS